MTLVPRKRRAERKARGTGRTDVESGRRRAAAVRTTFTAGRHGVQRAGAEWVRRRLIAAQWVSGRTPRGTDAQPHAVGLTNGEGASGPLPHVRTRAARAAIR